MNRNIPIVALLVANLILAIWAMGRVDSGTSDHAGTIAFAIIFSMAVYWINQLVLKLVKDK